MHAERESKTNGKHRHPVPVVRIAQRREQSHRRKEKQRGFFGKTEKDAKKIKKGLDKDERIVYNVGCRKPMQPAAGDEYTEKYSRGRRGAPAKGVGRLIPAREFKSLLLRQRKVLKSQDFRTFSLFFSLFVMGVHRVDPYYDPYRLPCIKRKKRIKQS